MQYDVQVSRTDLWITTISVEADSLGQAKEKALALASSSSFDVEADPVYDIDFVDELVPSIITPIKQK